MTTLEEALAAIDKEFAEDVNDFGDVGHTLELARKAITDAINTPKFHADAKCKNCRHWHPFDEVVVHGLNTADILKLGLCGKIIDDQDVEPEGQLALSEDCSGLSGLRTAAEFGCVLFEARCVFEAK